MATDLAPLPRRAERHNVGHRPDWRRGYRSMRALLDDGDSTQHAFDTAFYLDGDAAGRRLDRVLATPEGRALYAERPRLSSYVADRAALAELPEGSFGRAYLEFLDANGYDPVGLSTLRKKTDRVADRDDGSEWMAERADFLHDFWHVLSGYGTNGFGEAALLPFSTAQVQGRSNWMLTIGAALRSWRRIGGWRWPVLLVRAYRRGRKAKRLDAVHYEALLAMPLDEVRTMLGIVPLEIAHPHGEAALLE